MFFFSSRRRHTRCALVTGVQTCALPISPMRAFFRPGRRAPMHASAVGKAMLAEIDDAVLTEVLHQKGMPRFTEKTIVDPAALRCELARIRERGWAVDDEEHTVGMRCVAATIHNEHGEVIAGVSVRSEEHTSELQSLMSISYAVF